MSTMRRRSPRCAPPRPSSSTFRARASRHQGSCSSTSPQGDRSSASPIPTTSAAGSSASGTRAWSPTRTTRRQSRRRSWCSGGAGRTATCTIRPPSVSGFWSASRGVPARRGSPRSWRRHGVAEQLRILVAGWLNSPHVAAWADAVVAAGHEAELVGRVVPGWPELELSVRSHRLAAELPPPLRGLHMSRELGRVAADYEPDLVHAHYLPEYGWMAAHEGLGPLVCSAWGSDVLAAGRLARLRSRRAPQAAALVLVDSAHLAREVRALARRDVR